MPHSPHSWHSKRPRPSGRSKQHSTHPISRRASCSSNGGPGRLRRVVFDPGTLRLLHPDEALRTLAMDKLVTRPLHDFVPEIAQDAVISDLDDGPTEL